MLFGESLVQASSQRLSQLVSRRMTRPLFDDVNAIRISQTFATVRRQHPCVYASMCSLVNHRMLLRRCWLGVQCANAWPFSSSLIQGF